MKLILFIVLVTLGTTLTANCEITEPYHSTEDLIVNPSINTRQSDLPVIPSEIELEIDQTNLPQPVAFVQKFLAFKLNIEQNIIKVIQIEHRIWADGCFELPAPEYCGSGKVSGFRVILEALDRRYVYHTDEVDGFMFAGFSDIPNK